MIDRIISIYQPHLRPIVRGKAKAKVEFGAKIGACIVNGYTYVDHLSWDAYNESSDLAMQIELYRKRFGMLPREVQVDKIYLGKQTGSISRTTMSSVTTAHWAGLPRRTTTGTPRRKERPLPQLSLRRVWLRTRGSAGELCLSGIAACGISDLRRQDGKP